MWEQERRFSSSVILDVHPPLRWETRLALFSGSAEILRTKFNIPPRDARHVSQSTYGWPRVESFLKLRTQYPHYGPCYVLIFCLSRFDSLADVDEIMLEKVSVWRLSRTSSKPMTPRRTFRPITELRKSYYYANCCASRTSPSHAG